jgi:hypothetical protein
LFAWGAAVGTLNQPTLWAGPASAADREIPASVEREPIALKAPDELPPPEPGERDQVGESWAQVGDAMQRLSDAILRLSVRLLLVLAFGAVFLVLAAVLSVYDLLGKPWQFVVGTAGILTSAFLASTYKYWSPKVRLTGFVMVSPIVAVAIAIPVIQWLVPAGSAKLTGTVEHGSSRPVDRPARRLARAVAELPVALKPDTFTTDGYVIVGVTTTDFLTRIYREDGEWHQRLLVEEHLDPVVGMTLCEGNLAVAYANGDVALRSPETGKQIVRRNIWPARLGVACADADDDHAAYLYAGLRDSGKLVRLDPTTLEPQSGWLRPLLRADILVGAPGKIVVGDAEAGRLKVVDTNSNASSDVADGEDAGQVVANGQAGLVTHPTRGCITRFSLADGKELPGASAISGDPRAITPNRGDAVILDGATAELQWRTTHGSALDAPIGGLPRAAISLRGMDVIAVIDAKRDNLRIFRTADVRKVASESEDELSTWCASR